MIGNSTPHTYLCFISYKHANAREAEWLQKKLESYRLPSKLCRKYPALPKRLSQAGNVYRDEDTLRPGSMAANLYTDMAATKYLIVLCSREAHDEPKYIQQEVETFLVTGHTYEQIIPLIIDDDPQPEKTCFPPILQRLSEEYTLIGANIHDSGREQALLKIIATMLGIQVVELQTAEERRRRKNRRIALLCTLAACILSCVAGYFAYDYYVPKTAYYLDYVEEWGLPKGIGELQKEELSGMSAFYALEMRCRKVQELRHENAAGKLIDHELAAHKDRSAQRVYSYGADGQLEKVACHDADGSMVMIMRYSGPGIIDLQSPDGNASVSVAADITALETGSYFDTDDDSSIRSGIIRYCVDYDEQGRETERRFAKDTWNTPVNDGSNVWGMRYERDSLGRVIRVVYLIPTNGASSSADNKNSYIPAVNKRGISGQAYQYRDNDLAYIVHFGKDGQNVLNEERYSSISLEYDSRHHRVRETYLGIHSEPVRSSKGYAGISYEYDTDGNCIHKVYFGVDGQPDTTLTYARIAYEYDDRGNNTLIQYFSADNTPVPNSNGITLVRMEYDEEGRRTRETYFDANGEPVLSKSGYAGKAYEYDERGNQIRRSFFDLDGAPILTPNGYASYTHAYDSNNLPIWKDYFDTDGNPVAASGSYASVRTEYDNRGNLIHEEYFDADGKPTLFTGGYASYRLEYDARGNWVRGDYFGTDGNPVLIPSTGYASITLEVDERGYHTREAYFGVNGEPVMMNSGYASFTAEYDAFGNSTRTAYFGIDGRPVMHPDGYSSITRQFDSRSNCIRESHFDTTGSPVMNANGYSSTVWTYDESGSHLYHDHYDTNGYLIACPNSELQTDENGFLYQSKHNEKGQWIRTDYFDTDRYAALNADGYSTITRMYDEHGNCIREDYFGIDGEPILHVNGYASHTWEYDDEGNIISRTAFDLAGNPITDANRNLRYDDRGFYYQAEFDDDGNWIRSDYFDAQGNPFLIPDGYSSITLEYDEAGNRTREAYWGLSGEPVLHVNGYASYTSEFDDQGFCICQSFFGIDGKPALNTYGYASLTWEYDENGEEIGYTLYDEYGEIIEDE